MTLKCCIVYVLKLFSLFLSNAYVSGTYFRCCPVRLAHGLTTNKKLGWKVFPGTNTLAYLAFSKMPQKKKFYDIEMLYSLCFKTFFPIFVLCLCEWNIFQVLPCKIGSWPYHKYKN
jgi:hypothetical protein